MTTATVRLHGHRPHALTVTLFVALLAAISLAVVLVIRGDRGTNEGSGVAATERRVVPPFSAVELAGETAMTVRAGPEQTVVVSADDNLLQRIKTRVRNGTLVVATPSSFKAVSPMTVDVTVPDLRAATLSGTGAMSIDGVEAKAFGVRLSGTGLMRVSGRIGRLEASLDGTGDGELGSLVARDVVASVSGTGRLTVHATRSLRGFLRGTGAIVYVGNPSKVTRNITGTGAIVEG